MGTGKVVAGILTVLGLAATSAPIAMAQESQEAGENNVPPTMLILDASGSMGGNRCWRADPHGHRQGSNAHLPGWRSGGF